LSSPALACSWRHPVDDARQRHGYGDVREDPSDRDYYGGCDSETHQHMPTRCVTVAIATAVVLAKEICPSVAIDAKFI
jgi:hypothetical protein